MRTSLKHENFWKHSEEYRHPAYKRKKPIGAFSLLSVTDFLHDRPNNNYVPIIDAGVSYIPNSDYPQLD